jgi:hypothetical protein
MHFIAPPRRMIAETCWFVRKRTDSKNFLDDDDPVSEVEFSESLTMDDDCFERGADPLPFGA